MSEGTPLTDHDEPLGQTGGTVGDGSIPAPVARDAVARLSEAMKALGDLAFKAAHDDGPDNGSGEGKGRPRSRLRQREAHLAETYRKPIFEASQACGQALESIRLKMCRADRGRVKAIEALIREVRDLGPLVGPAFTKWRRSWGDLQEWVADGAGEKMPVAVVVRIPPGGKGHDDFDGKPKPPAQGETDSGAESTHSPDFRSVRWNGQTFTFTANQAACVRILWEAWQAGTPDVGDGYTLEQAEAGEKRGLRHVFRDHPAWDAMIVSGATKGTHRIADPPEKTS